MEGPNFFIVGAPKSGTTALYQYLREHPEIHMPDCKEPHYFASDLQSSKFIREKSAYFALFEPQDGERIRGEASVYYLFSTTAAAEIHEFNPASKIIIMLRNPVEMIYSLHSQAVSSAYEDILDFGEALAAEAERKKGLRVPDIADCPQYLYYRDIGMYANQVGRFMHHFPSQQVQVILFDEFAGQPEAVYKQVLRFLEVKDLEFAPEFRKVNQNRRLVSVRLEHFLKRRERLRSRIKSAIPGAYSLLYSVFHRLNARKTPRKEMPPELRMELVAHFRPDIENLARIIDRDLAAWMN